MVLSRENDDHPEKNIGKEFQTKHKHTEQPSLIECRTKGTNH